MASKICRWKFWLVTKYTCTRCNSIRTTSIKCSEFAKTLAQRIDIPALRGAYIYVYTLISRTTLLHLVRYLLYTKYKSDLEDPLPVSNIRATNVIIISIKKETSLIPYSLDFNFHFIRENFFPLDSFYSPDCLAHSAPPLPSSLFKSGAVCVPPLPLLRPNWATSWVSCQLAVPARERERAHTIAFTSAPGPIVRMAPALVLSLSLLPLYLLLPPRRDDILRAPGGFDFGIRARTFVMSIYYDHTSARGPGNWFAALLFRAHAPAPRINPGCCCPPLLRDG